MDFNKEQQMAINHMDGACGVIAGAGSGKSTVLVNRIKKLIEEENVDPRDIIAITFTKNSSKDLKDKLSKLDIKDIRLGTFHAICARLLNSEGLDISKNLQEFEIENLFKRLNGDAKVDVNDIKSFISYQKNYMISYDEEFIEKESKYSEVQLRKFYKEYEKLKSVKRCYDFDDYLLLAHEVLNKKKGKYTCKYILVDEHQDTNLVQNELIDLLCPIGNIFCVFDYRQAIYTFRGGNPSYCMSFKKKYKDASIINLDINYRSTSNIVDKANRFIKLYYGDYVHYSNSISNNEEISNITKITSFDKIEESKKVADKIEDYIKQGVSPSEIAILYRMNSHSFELESELKYRDIDYDIDNKGGFFKRREMDIVLCVMRLINDTGDNIAYETLFRHRVYPFTYLNNVILDKIKLLASKKNLSFIDASELIKVDKPWQSKNLGEFSNIISSLTRQMKQGVGLKTISNNIMIAMKIHDFIENNYSNEVEIEERLQSLLNFNEFIRNNTLESFLSYVYCKSKGQRKNDEDKVQLMSIHKSKGLEFKHVFIIGIEDGKFPSHRSDLLDEARLFYVAATRAKEDLHMSQIYDGNKFVSEYFKTSEKRKMKWPMEMDKVGVCI